MLMTLISILLIWTSWETVETARILAVIPTASYSHQVFYRPLWKALAKRGHELVLLTTDPMRDSTIENIKEIDLSIAYQSWNNSVMDMVAANDDKLTFIRLISETLFQITRVELSQPEVQQLFHNKEEHFDLLIIEYFVHTMFIFKHRFNVPFIGVTSLDAPHLAHAIVGNPTHSVLYPSPVLAFDDKSLTFWDRINSLLFDQTMQYWSWSHFNAQMDSIVRETLGEGYPSVAELAQEVDMIFANTHPLFNNIRPFTPATISIAGGFHECEAKPLPLDLGTFLDSAQEGAIYFSLGSNVKSSEISEETRQIIIATFAQLPYKILWKFEADQLPGKPDNVKIQKWFPQQDVLRHRNVKLFITQAGLQSLEEALYAHVPVVAMPYFADQIANARHVKAKGLGLEVDHKTLTVETFKDAIINVMTNDKFRKKVQMLADLVHDQPMKPLDRAVWWIEYVLRHKGAKHLHGPKIPFYQIYYLDVFFIFFVLPFLICYGLYTLCVDERRTKGFFIFSILSVALYSWISF